MGLSHPAPRLIVPRIPPAGDRVRLEPEEAGHARARRLARGDSVILLDGSGAEGHGRLTRIDAARVEIDVDRVVAARPAGPEIVLAIAGLRPERLAWVVEKATEFAVGRVVLLRTERTQSFRASGELLARLSRVAREAAKQSESARWPALEGPRDLTELLSTESEATRIMLDASGRDFPGKIASGRAVTLCVGPEGGWTVVEREDGQRAGWSVCSLPAGKLRAETAAIAALSLTRAALLREP